MDTIKQPFGSSSRSPTDVARQRCHHHGNREAVARCPRCGHFYCRECVTEHDHRMLCNTCLQRTTAAGEPAARRWGRHVELLVVGGVGFLILWGVFYLIGQGLLAIPHAVHEGTIWQQPWWRTP